MDRKDVFLKMIEYIPLITGIVLIFGYIKIAAYYSIFGLQIINYLDLSEFVTQGIPEFVSIILFGGVGFLFPMTIGFYSKFDPNGSITYENYVKNNAIKFNNIPNYISFVGLVITALYLIVKLIIYHKLSDEVVIRIGFGLSTFGILFFSQLIPFEYLKRSQEKFDKRFFIILTLSLLYLLITYSSNLERAISVKFDNYNVGNSIEINNKLIVSTANYFYIGESNKYVFFYNKVTHENAVYKKDLISVIRLR